METKYYEYVGTQEQANGYANRIPIIGNIYPDSEKMGVKAVIFWASGSDSISNEWKLVEKEQSTNQLIELLNKQAAKDGMTCSVTFEKKPDVEITDFYLSKAYKNGLTRVVFYVNLENLQVQNKENQLIEAIKRELEND
jgi:hypothetical protein